MIQVDFHAEQFLFSDHPFRNLLLLKLNNKVNLLAKILSYTHDRDLKSVMCVCKILKLIENKSKPISCEKFYEFYDSRSVSESDEPFSKSPYNYINDDLIFAFDS